MTVPPQCSYWANSRYWLHWRWLGLFNKRKYVKAFGGLWGDTEINRMRVSFEMSQIAASNSEGSLSSRYRKTWTCKEVFPFRRVKWKQRRVQGSCGKISGGITVAWLAWSVFPVGSGKLFSTSKYLVSPGSSFIQYHACLTVFFLSTSFSICLWEHAGVKPLSALSHSLNSLNFLY